MHVRLTPDLEKYVSREVKRGGYATTSEFVRQLIRKHQEDHSPESKRELEDLRRELSRAIASLDAGLGTTLNTPLDIADHIRRL